MDAKDYWKEEVLFQIEENGIKLTDFDKQGIAEEVADELLGEDYLWEKINDYILRRIGDKIYESKHKEEE